jgi:hypothetical protein
MIESDPMFKSLGKTAVGNMVQVRSQVGLFDIQKSFWIVVSRTVRQDIVNSESTLAPRGNEDDDGFGWGILDNGQIRGLGHGYHERGEMWDGETLQVDVHI